MFTNGDTVLVKTDAPAEMRPGQLASVVGITTDRKSNGSDIDEPVERFTSWSSET